jgi:hypothetical protein
MDGDNDDPQYVSLPFSHDNCVSDDRATNTYNSNSRHDAEGKEEVFFYVSYSKKLW